ncbi:MAG: DinB family protein [Anaerolineae bacterium]|nr:DinB family protein [Anaerolineae bacterium]NUQ06308.1 DinB family protein [Anaerolineae bacterium]
MSRTYAHPQEGDYASYAIVYIARVPQDGLLLDHLTAGERAMETLMRGFSDTDRVTPHRAGEWTVQDILAHIIDTERVLCYRVLALARGEKKELPGFEEAEWAAIAGANGRSIDDLLAEYHAVRAATLPLVRSLPDSVLANRGVANKYVYTVAGILYMIVGHELHHIASIHENYGDRLR